jgi:hypothetical protein
VFNLSRHKVQGSVERTGVRGFYRNDPIIQSQDHACIRVQELVYAIESGGGSAPWGHTRHSCALCRSDDADYICIHCFLEHRYVFMCGLRNVFAVDKCSLVVKNCMQKHKLEQVQFSNTEI